MKLGELSEGSEVGLTDAIHIPICTVRSYDQLQPGDPIYFVDDTFTEVKKVEYQDRSYQHGIVDPFISQNDLNCGSPFVVLLRPGSAGNLRHAFDLKFDEFPQPEYWGDDECRFCN